MKKLISILLIVVIATSCQKDDDVNLVKKQNVVEVENNSSILIFQEYNNYINVKVENYTTTFKCDSLNVGTKINILNDTTLKNMLYVCKNYDIGKFFMIADSSTYKHIDFSVYCYNNVGETNTIKYIVPTIIDKNDDIDTLKIDNCIVQYQTYLDKFYYRGGLKINMNYVNSPYKLNVKVIDNIGSVFYKEITIKFNM